MGCVSLSRWAAIRVAPDGPYIGSLCCVVAAGELIAEEFRSWPHVIDVEVDVTCARVEVELRGLHAAAASANVRPRPPAALRWRAA